MKWNHRLEQWLLDAQTREHVAASSKQTGSLGYDPWGFHLDVNRVGLGLMKWVYERYYRTEAIGLEHVPTHGRVLVISNHSGFLPMDGVLIGVAMALNPNGARLPRAMIERFFPTVPYLGNMMNGLGAVLGDVHNCRDMLLHEEAVIVFPEGARGTGKGWKNRYNLQRFGLGFMHLAMETQTPILPVGIAGCEESFPMFGDIPSLARMMAVPYIPLGLPFLPSKVVMHFGPLMHFDNNNTSETSVQRKVHEVRSTIEHLVQKSRALRSVNRD